MVRIFTYIYHKNQPDVGKYTIHGSSGYVYGQDLTFAPLCNATSFGMVQMYCK